MQQVEPYLQHLVPEGALERRRSVPPEHRAELATGRVPQEYRPPTSLAAVLPEEPQETQHLILPLKAVSTVGKENLAEPWVLRPTMGVTSGGRRRVMLSRPLRVSDKNAAKSCTAS